MTNLLVFSLLFVLPFVVLPFGISFFETPKVVIGEVLIELLVFLRLLGGKFRFHHQAYLIKGAVLGLVLLSLWHLVVSGFSENIFWGNPYRLQGIFLLWHLILLLIFSNGFHFLGIPKPLYVFFLAVLAIETILFGQNLAGRAVGPLGEPNALAATALFFFPFALTSKKMIFNIAAIFLVGYIIFLSGSKSGILGLFLVGFFLFLIKKTRISTGKAVAISLLLIVLSLSLPFIEKGGWFENRSEVWRTAAAAGVRQPIWGNGFGNIENTLREISKDLENNVQYQIVDSSHNILLDFWVQGGALGLVFFLFLLGVFTIRAKANIILLSSFLGIFTIMMFNPVSIVNLIELWWILGQGLKLDIEGAGS